MGLNDGLKEASESEVVAWFEARPEYQEMLIQDMRKKLGLHFLKEFKHVFQHTDFLVHPIIGMIPRYLTQGFFDSIGNVVEKPDFESCGYDDECNRYLYKRPWFLIWVKENYGEIDTGIELLDRFESLVNQFSSETEQYREDLNDYFYGWMNRIFSNRRRFVEVSDLEEVNISDLRESEGLEGAEAGGDVEIYARVLESDEGRIYIEITDGYVMEVASNEEAEKILKEIWV